MIARRAIDSFTEIATLRIELKDSATGTTWVRASKVGEQA